MNPCPGGCDTIKTCDCSPEQLNRYRHKLSAPLLDRIDIQIELNRLEPAYLVNTSTESTETSRVIQDRVCKARELQFSRQRCLNAQLENQKLAEVCQLDQNAETILLRALEKLRMSARSYHKLLKLARSVADLAATKSIGAEHIAEAISYRQQDRHRA